ncbi:N-formylglutamate amidohydrolase [Chelativorans sp. YIM 93263]|uniref:N-formylglutamate amidohydrolase n=1 Tax=Chelativorans sp. YIM 93263 TaxID=2906648 RepID=UPI002379C008|nr:N-formylglutamate amidohydrolase [Chelativorans sp. YIM 93263]
MLARQPVLTEADGAPFEVINPRGESPVVLVCEHASSRVPVQLGNLGLAPDQLNSHVGWDPGARDLALELSETFDAPLVAARFSRLVYDCNRPPHAPSAIPYESEVCLVPGNREVSPAERDARAQALYGPFHRAVSETLVSRRNGTQVPVMLTIHSFTPVFHGVARKVEIGFLHGEDGTLAQDLAADCRARSGYDVRLNEPYAPKDGVLHTIDRHLADGPFPYAMIEVRNDLLTNPDKRADILALLSSSLRAVLSVQ